MRVLVVGPIFPDSFARNILVTLQAMRHDAFSIPGVWAVHHGNRWVNALRRSLPGIFPILDRRHFDLIIRAARRLNPDLVLVTYGITPPEVVQRLKESCSARVVCWFTDAIPNLHRDYLIGSAFDAIFVKEPALVRLLREKIGLPAYYLPECCNPIWHRTVALTQEDRRRYGCDIAAAGTLHYYRARMLEALDGYDLKIWGRNAPPWVATSVKNRYRNCYVAEESKAKAFRAAKIVVNTIHYTEIEGVNCTCFEAAACGAFQIADWRPALAELFEVDREIVTYRSRGDLKERVDYYLAHPAERQQIAARAEARAHREHTYAHRLNKMFEIMGLPAGDPLLSGYNPNRVNWLQVSGKSIR